MLAYRPGLLLFISRLYHTHHLITNSVSAGASVCEPALPALFVHLGKRYGKNVVVVGKGRDKRSPFPLLSFANYFIYYIRV